MKIVIELTEQGEKLIEKWLISEEHRENREICNGDYREYIRRTGKVFNSLQAPLAIKIVRFI